MPDLDRFIAAMPVEEDDDLMLCREHGVAWQADRAHRVNYGAEYFDKCKGYEGAPIAEKINAGRVALVARHFGGGPLVDVGIGSGEFIRTRPCTWGYDVNPLAAEWLKRRELWAGGKLMDFSAFSWWDVIEHVPEPEQYLRHVPLHGFAFFSLPIFHALGGIRLSRHYRPGEHLYYWTEEGFVRWMETHGFRLLERADFEIQAGRESILSFAFRRYRWPQ